MKLVLKIAKNELRNLFYSPVAWVMTIVFLVICAAFYSDPMVDYANRQDSLLKTMPSFNGFKMSLTKQIFTKFGGDSFIRSIFGNLYLFIPLLTMGLINREFNGGTFKLLYSSPVKIRNIVWGKFLAVMFYNLLLMSIVLMFMVAGFLSINNLDAGLLVCSLIAFYLVVCTYTAIGLFMSSISNYSIVAAMATFIVLFLLEKVGGVWQEHDFFRDLTYFLSISGRSETMISGLITSKDVMYYVLITSLFVTYTYLSLKHGRELVSVAKKTVRYVSVFLMILVLGYLTSRPGYIGYWDGTRNQENTIPKETQDILAKMQDEPMEVTLYTNLLGKGFNETRPSERNAYVWKVWDKYVRFKPNMKFNYVLYYDVLDGDSTLYKMMPNKPLDSIALRYARMKNAKFKKYLKPAEIREQIDLRAEGLRAIMELKYKGKRLFLRTYEDPSFWPFESHFAAAFKRLSNDTIPKVYVSTGNYERSMLKTGEREYFNFTINKSNRFSLLNNGFEFDTLNLDYQDIPNDATAILVADPKSALSSTKVDKLNNHIRGGGNVIYNGEPDKQHILNPVLRPLGVSLDPGTLVQVSENETPDKIVPYMSMDYSWLVMPESKRMKAAREYFEKGDSVKMLNVGAVGVSYADSGYQLSRTWVSRPKGYVWSKMGQLVIDSVPPVMNEKEGDYKVDSFNIAIALQGNAASKGAKIAITGDSDWLSNLRGGNQVSGTDYLSWMCNEAFPVRIEDKPLVDDMLTIGLTAAKTQKMVFNWIIPGTLAVLGSLLLLRRKRK